MEPLVKVEKDGGTTVLKLNDPKRRNPLSAELRDQLIAAIGEAFVDSDCRAIVLVGEGGSFCAGGDVSQMTAAVHPDPLATQRRTAAIQELMKQVATGPKPVVVAIEGAAFGAGLSLAAASDWVVAGVGAKFSAAFVRLGVMPDCGLLWSLPARIGMGWARDMLVSARVVEAEEARALGLVNELVPQGTALEHAMRKAESYAEVGPLGIAATKSALPRASVSFNAALAAELDILPMLVMTADHAEARDAFLEKRKPVFEGR